MAYSRTRKLFYSDSESTIDVCKGNELRYLTSVEVLTSEDTCKPKKANKPHDDSYRNSSNGTGNLTPDEKRKINTISNEVYSNWKNELCHEQNSTRRNKEFLSKTESPKVIKAKDTLPDEMNNNVITSKSHSSRKPKLNTKISTKPTTHATKRNENKTDSQNDFTQSEQSSIMYTKSKLSAYFQSFIPKQKVDSSDSCIRLNSLLPHPSKPRKESSPKRVKSTLKNNRKMKANANADDPKIALRIKYIKWLQDEKKFFNTNSLDGKESIQTILARSNTNLQGNVPESTQTLVQNKKKQKDSKKHKKSNKQNSTPNKIQNVSGKIELNDVLVYNNSIIQDKKVIRQNRSVRVYTSTENAVKQIKTNENVKRAVSLDGASITFNITASNAKNNCLQTNRSDSNENDFNTTFTGRSPIKTSVSTEKQDNVNANNQTIDYLNYNNNFVSNESNENKLKNCTKSTDSVTIIKKVPCNNNNYILNEPTNIEIFKMDYDSEVNSQPNNWTEPDCYRTYDSYLQDPKIQISYNSPSQYESNLFYNSVINKPDNTFLTNTECFYHTLNIQQSERKENYTALTKKENSYNLTRSNYSYSNVTEMNDENELKRKYANHDCFSVNDSSKENIHNNANTIQFINRYQDEIFNINKNLLAIDKVREMAHTNNILEENLIRETKYYELENANSNDNCNLKSLNNKEYSIDNYQREYDTETNIGPRNHSVASASSQLQDNKFQTNSKERILCLYSEETKNQLCYYNNAVYEKVGIMDMNAFKSERINSEQRKQSSSEGLFELPQTTGNENTKHTNSECQELYKETNVAEISNCTSAELNNNLNRQKAGRKRKYINNKSESDDEVCNDYTLELIHRKPNESSLITKNEQNKNIILSVMSELQDKVNLLQDQISTMNTSCNKFENIETLLVMLTTDVSQGLKQVENKLKDITREYTGSDTEEHSTNTIKNTRNISSKNRTNSLTLKSELENLNNSLHSREYKDVGLMTSPCTLCNTCDKLSSKEIKETCIFDKGVQCRINESQYKDNEAGQSSFLAVEDSNIVFIENLIKTNKIEDKASSNTNTNLKIKKVKSQKQSLPKVSSGNMKRTKLKTCIIL